MKKTNNKISLHIAVLLVSATLLAACGNQGTTTNQVPAASVSTTESTTPETDTTAETETTADTDNKSWPPSSDNIKWDEIQDPLIDNTLKEKLKASVKAIVAKDVVAFHKTLGPDVGTVHDYLLDNPVTFTDVDRAHEENGRTLILVRGNKLGEDAEEMGYTFYFEKDNNGEWQIVAID